MAIETIKKIDRCLRVLENVSYQNDSNQNYLILYESSTLIKSITRTMKCIENMLPSNIVSVDGEGKTDKCCTGFVLFSCILSILRVLLNLTHNNVTGASLTGQQAGFIQSVLACVFTVPQYVPAEEQFDLLVLSLGLLINVIENCDGNRDVLVNTEVVTSFSAMTGNAAVSSIDALVQLFLERLTDA